MLCETASFTENTRKLSENVAEKTCVNFSRDSLRCILEDMPKTLKIRLRLARTHRHVRKVRNQERVNKHSFKKLTSERDTSNNPKVFAAIKRVPKD